VKILGLIPARAGSKGSPDKNVRPLAGKSLVERAFECGRAAGVLDRIVLSTDDVRIARIAQGIGLENPAPRPPELAADTTPMIDVVTHVLVTLEHAGYVPDAVMLLQPTSPLRKPEHVRAAVRALGDHDAVCTVVPVPKELCPHYVMKIDDAGFLDYFLPDGRFYTRRQDVPQAYRRDGTIYLVRRAVVLEQRSLYGQSCVPLVITADESLTVDTPADWATAEAALA
jgi:CMP-N-acetylneuraminic acid synthetase